MSYPDFDALNPERSICFLSFDGQFRRDVGENLLPDGDMESAVVTPPWTVVSGIASKEPGTRPGGTGSQVLKLSSVLTTSVRMYQAAIFTPAHTYSIRGWAEGDAVKAPALYESAFLWTGTYTADWQYCDVVRTAVGQYLQLYCTGGGPVSGYSNFDDWSVFERPQVCRSLSKLSGVLNYARMGDGHTASTMPTQRAGRGLVFDGGDYINLDWASGGSLDTTTFTFLCYAKALSQDVTVEPRLFEMGSATGTNWFIFTWLASSQTLRLRVYKAGTLTLDLNAPQGYPDGQGHTYAIRVSSVGCSILVDGVVLATASGDFRPSLPSDSLAMIGAYTPSPTSANYCFNGDMYSAAIYPFALTQTQVREVGRRMRQLRNA